MCILWSEGRSCIEDVVLSLVLNFNQTPSASLWGERLLRQEHSQGKIRRCFCFAWETRARGRGREKNVNERQKRGVIRSQRRRRANPSPVTCSAVIERGRGRKRRDELLSEKVEREPGLFSQHLHVLFRANWDVAVINKQKSFQLLMTEVVSEKPKGHTRVTHGLSCSAGVLHIRVLIYCVPNIWYVGAELLFPVKHLKTSIMLVRLCSRDNTIHFFSFPILILTDTVSVSRY